MKAYECYSDILANGQLSVPSEIINRLKTLSRISVMIFVEEDDIEWNDFALTLFLTDIRRKTAPMTRYEFGHIVLIGFPHTDLQSLSKIRYGHDVLLDFGIACCLQ